MEIDSAGDAAFGAPPCTGEGVRAPALATLDPSAAIGLALVVHYVEPWNAPRACGAEAGVRAVRLRGAASASGRSGRFELEGTLDLGAAASTTRPAIAALPDRSGWLVAFGRAAGGVRVERVSASGEHTSVGVVEGAAPGSQVVMRSGESGVGLAWIEGCAGGPARFAIVRPSGAFEGPTVFDALASEVALVALSTGLVEAGFTRGERTAQEADRGGWLAVTRDESAVRAHRLLALDAEVLGEPQSIALAARALGLVTSAGALPADLHAWQSDGELVRVPLGCGR